MKFNTLPFVLYIKHLKEMSAKTIIESGKAILGIEFGSTRIKAVLIDTDNNPIAQGSFEWETSWLMVSGLTASTQSGKVCRIVMPTSART